MLLIVVVVSCVMMKIVFCSALSHEVLNSQHYKHSHAKCLYVNALHTQNRQLSVSDHRLFSFCMFMFYKTLETLILCDEYEL